MAGALLLHMVTCTWYAVGDRPGGWVRDEGLESLPQWVQYRMAAEWALSRLPPSRMSDNMSLKTQEERGVAFLMTTLAMAFASIFTSIVTNDISDIRRAHKAQRGSHVQLSNYLATYPVPWDLEKELQAQQSLEPWCLMSRKLALWSLRELSLTNSFLDCSVGATKARGLKKLQTKRFKR